MRQFAVAIRYMHSALKTLTTASGGIHPVPQNNHAAGVAAHEPPPWSVIVWDPPNHRDWRVVAWQRSQNARGDWVVHRDRFVRAVRHETAAWRVFVVPISAVHAPVTPNADVLKLTSGFRASQVRARPSRAQRRQAWT